MKKLLFVFMLSVLALGLVWGQTPFTATYTFGANGNVQSFAYNGTDYPGISMGNIDKIGVTTSSSSGNFRATYWPFDNPGGIDTDKYIGFTISADSGYQFTVSSITFGIGRSATGTRHTEVRGNADSYAAAIDNYTNIATGLTNTNGVLENPDTNGSWTGNVLELGQEYEAITNCGFRIYLYNSEGSGGTAGLQGPITISGTYVATGGTPDPFLAVDHEVLNGFSYIVGSGPSAIQSFKVSGAYLNQNVTITAPEDYEISLSETEDFDEIYILDEVGGELAETTLFVRLKEGLAAGNYNGKILEIESSGVQKTITLNGVVESLPLPGYFVNFEDATKTGYALGTVTLNGMEWSFEQALLGDNANDRKFNGKSARLRYDSASTTYGSVTMLEPKPNGTGTISFYYSRANFGGDNTGNSPKFVVEYSADGVTWRQAGSETDLTGVDELTLFSADVNLVCELRIRVRQTAGDNNKRWNIDNFNITDFEATGDLIADIPNLQKTKICAEISVMISGSDAQALSLPLPTIPNKNFIMLNGFVLDLFGSGPWYMIWYTSAPWAAYHHGGQWHTAQNDGFGNVLFPMITASKNLLLPVIFGNEDPTLPVELSSFLATMNAQNQAVLSWISQSESGLAGYYVLRNTDEDLATAVQISNLIDASNTSSAISYSYIDSEISEHGTYYYWLQVNDLDGSISYHGPISLVFSAAEEPELPPVVQQSELKRIYPNPFNPNTNVAYYLAKGASVSLKIYNHRGQLVRSLHEGYKDAGDYRLSWDAKDDKGAAVSTGVYFFRLEAGNKVFTQKAVLMK